MQFWKQKKSSVIAVLPAASREAGRVVTSEESSINPAQRRSRLLRAFNPPATEVNAQKSPAPSRAIVRPSINRVDRTWMAIFLLGILLLFNIGLNGWVLWRTDQKYPGAMNQNIELERTQEELALLRTKTESFVRNADTRMKSLQSDVDSARDHLQILEHESRQALRAYQKPPVYGLNGVVTQTEVQQ